VTINVNDVRTAKLLSLLLLQANLLEQLFADRHLPDVVAGARAAKAYKHLMLTAGTMFPERGELKEAVLEFGKLQGVEIEERVVTTPPGPQRKH
jgi:hypothetical protein